MKIERVLFAPGKSSFYFDDQRAIRKGAQRDGLIYLGSPVTEGFQRIREAGESVSILLVMEDGRTAVGDCVAVQYSGAAGRDPLFKAETYIPVLEERLRPRLEGREVQSFKEMLADLEDLESGPQRLHTALRYGISQALLDARALVEGKPAFQVLCEEYDLPLIYERFPLFGQSGDNRYENVDKMILKELEALPHGLINNVDEKLGQKGEKLRDYVQWLVQRIEKYRMREDYMPDIHLDVYGTVGMIFDADPRKVAEYLADLEKIAAPHKLYVEGPVDLDGKEEQIKVMKGITENLRELGSEVKVVADEWCNTREDIAEFADAQCCHMIQIKAPDLGGIQNSLESILYCKDRGMEAYLGGSCNETDVSTRACVHLAMAARPERMLIKPGMGLDEGLTIVNNEMERIIARKP